MRVEESYDHWASSYDAMANKTRDLDLIVTQQIVDQHAPIGGKYNAILEIGCGTGKNTAWLAQRCLKLVATDFSESMLAIGRRKIADAHVQWQRFDITKTWPEHPTRFDLITFNLVMEHVEDLRHVFFEAVNRLQSEGILVISELHPFKQYLGSKARFETADGTYELQVFTHHVSDFMGALTEVGLPQITLQEWFDEDRSDIPRLLTLVAKR